MASRTLFQSQRGTLCPKTNAFNEEYAPAYALPPKHALAQYCVTGCLGGTFYADETVQLDQILALCSELPPEFIARTALYTRRRGFMKDTPALLCAVLAARAPQILERVFDRVIDNAKMLRNFVQILRSGVVGRKSLGTLPKRLVLRWLESRSDDALFRASVGRKPSLADIIKMVHPKPKTPSREAFYGYLLDRPHKTEALPDLVRQFEAYKKGQTADVPDVPFEMLTALELGPREWTAIARMAGWHMTRMNLNTFARNGVFTSPGVEEITRILAERLSDPKTITRSRVFPYQLMLAYAMADQAVPPVVRESLQDAMEIAIANVPAIDGKVYVFADVSGSMHSPVSGYRPGATSVVRCMDVAALMAAAVLRKNPSAEVIPFESDVVKVTLNPRDSVMTNAAKLASIGGGGTNCSAPLAMLNRRKATGDLVIYVSDYESWIDSPLYSSYGHGPTATMREWSVFRQRNPQARMICIDLQPYRTTQAAERADILNVGGFSDQVFEIIAQFAAGRLNPQHWAGLIEEEEI